ncbi:MAG: hypothetical protein HY202_00435, partial [Nitrospirae bacterium]|nr:hypothetical protein [Nitrospirota bacterium]
QRVSPSMANARTLAPVSKLVKTGGGSAGGPSMANVRTVKMKIKKKVKNKFKRGVKII